MQVTLFDAPGRQQLYPFTHTRAVADIRCGIWTMRERWELVLNMPESGTLTADYLMPIYPETGAGMNLLVNGGLFPDAELILQIQNLESGQALYADKELLALRTESPLPTFSGLPSFSEGLKRIEFGGAVKSLQHPWDIFSFNEAAIRYDFQQLTQGRSSENIPAGVQVIGTDLFLEAGAVLQAGSIINTTTGPVYIGKGAEVMEACIIRGSLALGAGATLKMGAKIYGGTTIGPACKVGGEVSNSVFFANSNKGHDGFLGNAVIGEWCNLGADTNSSNLKNNYDEVKIWDEAARKSVRTGLTFCGLLMGDHSKSGINTMFNTGTVAGVSCNIWGAGFPEKFIPSFTWGGPQGMSTYQFQRAMETAERMMARRGKVLGDAERKMLQHVFEATTDSRSLMMGVQ